MAELDIDPVEISLIMMGLTYLEDACLTEDGKAARARLAHKLRTAAAQTLAAMRDGAP